MKRWFLFTVLFLALLTLIGLGSSSAWTPVPVKQDPLVRMPGSQPDGTVTLESPGRCTNCHGGFNPSVEPAFNWQGSMMAQAARDFLYWSCVTVAAQDSIWAVGTPNATDICLRCHFPQGWVEGRSDPTNGSLMTGSDYDGVHCDFCHNAFDPFYQTTKAGTREGSDWVGYWDEATTLSASAAQATYNADVVAAQAIKLFSGQPFYLNNTPVSPNYTENAGGQFFLSGTRDKRASFADASGRHGMFYSRYHKSKYFCATCHDVSNPVLANAGLSGLPDDGSGNLITEQYSAHRYFHVERTFSEFMLSDYGLQGGSAGIGPYAPALFKTSRPNNNIAACQDCHMRDGVGKACSQNDGVIRPTNSLEHPKSGQPIHDLTGGNAWVSHILASTVSGSPNFDPVNSQLLSQGPSVLTLDLNQGLGIDPAALLAGVDRAKQQLNLAASIQNVVYTPNSGALSFRIQNQTGHKLISGFPEGRRMFINIQAYKAGALIYQVNPYDFTVGTLKGLPLAYSPSSPALGPNEVYVDSLVYETHPSSTDLTGEHETFHFALATGRYKDNRIPPKGFRIAEAAGRISTPVDHGVDAPNMYSAAEYAGGYDDQSITLAPGADYVVLTLYYQTTSREYIEFLRDEINGTGKLTLSSPTPSGEPQAYIIQTDPFFSKLKAWGSTIWSLWTHNMNVDGAKPFMMTQNAWGTPPPTCTAPSVTVLQSATPGNGSVAITWTAVTGAAGYKVYYDQAGKSVFIADAGNTTSFTDSGLTNGTQYCYKVTAYKVCPDGTVAESAFSNILCAIPNNQGQAKAGVDMIETGKWVTTGSGKNKVTTFVLTQTFAQGDAIVVRAHVRDITTNLPVVNATVSISVTGPATTTLTTGPSGTDGWAAATWQTTKPNKQGQGGTPLGSYRATTTNVTATGYTWDGVMTSTTFAVQ